MTSKSHCCAEKLTTAKTNRHQVLVCTFRHVQLLGKKASTTEISELKTEGELENSKVFFSQSWHFIPFLTYEKSGMASPEDSLLLSPHNWYTEKYRLSLPECSLLLYRGASLSSGSAFLPLQSLPLCKSFHQLPTSTCWS